MEKLVQAGQRQTTGRVYCFSEPHFELGDGTPLYLEWLLEGNDYVLYTVPAELGGWRQRRRYTGSHSSIRPVLQAKAQIIVTLLCSEVEHRRAIPIDIIKQKAFPADKALPAEVNILPSIPKDPIVGMPVPTEGLPAYAARCQFVEAAG